MSDYIIATSSTADLPRTWLDAHGVRSSDFTFGDYLFLPVE